VESIRTDDYVQIKNDLGIPEHMQACHTTVIGGYFVEGHVPIEAVRKLLDEQPAVDGIALPGMPQGSPGMGGDKLLGFVIYSVTDGTVEQFVTL
jgi:hypothetical protein